MIPLLTVIDGAGLWREEGIDVRHFESSDDPLDAEEQLFDGRIDFIFGNHLSPYLRLTQGKPIVCFFGDSPPERWGPWGVSCRVLRTASGQVSDLSVRDALEACADLASANVGRA